MLETLTKGFRNARDRFRGATELTEENVGEALREVRSSLLEADVDLQIVRDFLKRVTDACTGEEVRLKAGKKGRRQRVSPSDHFTKACFDELVALMGEEEPLPPAKGTRVLMLIGLQGTGKTSAAAKLARLLKSQGERPLLVAADVYRPAARDQLQVLADQIAVDMYTREGEDAAGICVEAVTKARQEGYQTVILDTAGRLQIDDELMQELDDIVVRVQPEHIALVCDAMIGREAVNVAQGFKERLDIDGLILTKLDGDARGGAALAIRAATGVPVRYATVGEGVDRLESFRPEGMASRILGMGDVVGLVQDFEQVVDEEVAEAEAEKLLKGKFSLQDFLSQLRTLQKMGPLKDLLEKMPGISEMMPEGVSVDGRELGKIEAMILSMTPEERQRPDIIDASRQARIARGSGTSDADLSGMLQRFEAMRQIMAQVGKFGPGLLGKIPGLGKLFDGGVPGVPGLDPSELGELAGMPGMGVPANREQARLAKLEARRKKRKQLKKHKKRGKRR